MLIYLFILYSGLCSILMYSRTDSKTISYEDISDVDIIKYTFYAGFQNYYSLLYTIYMY